MTRRYLGIPREAAALVGGKLTASDVVLLAHIHDRVHGKSKSVSIGMRRLAEISGLGLTTIVESLKRIEDAGQLEIERAQSLFYEDVNIYRLPGANGLAETPKSPSQRIRWTMEHGFVGILAEDMEEWSAAYPAVDLAGETRRAHIWLKANPAKKKRNYYRFLTNWFKGNQERGGNVRSNKPQKSILELAEEGERKFKR